MTHDDEDDEVNPLSKAGLAARFAAEWNETSAGVGLRERLDHIRAQRNLAHVAYTSAEVFSPDQAEAVKEFLEAISKVEKKSLFLLAGGTMSPREVGIKTDLKPDAEKVLVNAEIGDRKIAEDREHELELARISALGPMWAVVAKYVAVFIGGLVLGGLALFGIRVL